MKRYNVIAVDGPAGSGKSTVAGMVAERLGYIHADSGAIYRTITLAMMRIHGEGETPEQFGQILGPHGDCSSSRCRVVLEGGKQSNRIGEEDVGDAIRTPEVTSRIKFIADNPRCRDEVNRLLREFSSQTSLVVDGRDIGTVVFPETPYKFFLTATARIRAERRMNEFTKGGRLELTLDDVEKEIQKRDREDENRAVGALRQAGDAILIDTTELGINDVVAKLLSYLQIQF